MAKPRQPAKGRARGLTPGINPVTYTESAREWLAARRPDAFAALHSNSLRPTTVRASLGVLEVLEDSREILRLAEARPAKNYRAGMLTAINLLLHQLGILRLTETFSSAVVTAIVGHSATTSPPIAPEEGVALRQASASLDALKGLVAKLREREPSWKLAPRDPSVSRKSMMHDFVRAALETCRGLGVPEPTGLELAALAILRGHDRPIVPLPDNLVRGRLPERTARSPAQIQADADERDKRERKWANALRRVRAESTHTKKKS